MTSISGLEGFPSLKPIGGVMPNSCWFLVRHTFNPEDGSDISKRNISFSPNSTIYCGLYSQKVRTNMDGERSEVFTMISVKGTAFWDMPPCYLVYVQ
jgi:hypothetical protein